MEKPPKNLYIVIPAGGIGTRLWPRSRRATPKQFLKLSGGKSIIQEAVERLEGFIPYERIFIVASDIYKQLFFEQLPKFLPQNFISEPEKRGTSAAVGLATIFLRRINLKAVVHFLVSDDYIKDVPKFQTMISLAAQVAEEKNALIVYGVKPTCPATGYGYIQVGEKVKETSQISVYSVKRFIEKPDEEKAKQFLISGDYFWHGSGFTSQVGFLLEEMKLNWPQGFKILAEIEKLSRLPADLEEGKSTQLFSQLEDIPIEISILEKAKKVLMITLESTWRDIGSWKTVYDISKKDKDGNVVIPYGKEGEFIGLDSKNNLIHFNDQLIATIGVRDLIIVDTTDAVLICPKNRAEEVKKLVELLKKQGKNKYL